MRSTRNTGSQTQKEISTRVQPHPVFEPPDGHAQLWRYMDFIKFVSLLDTAELNFSRSDMLGDPFEGSLPKPVAHQREVQPEREFLINNWNVRHFGSLNRP
jgi:hypothetical protein